MRFGYMTLTDNPLAYGANRRDANQFLLDVLEECVLADELGFDSVWVPEHHFGLFGCLPSPSVFLSHVAARTKRVRLGPATVVTPLNQPLRLAEEWALLDLLSHGRTVFSAGRGYDEREYGGFAVPYAESRERFDEELLLIRKAWTEPSLTFHGKYHHIEEPVTILPRPVQQPHPPIYVACFSRPTVEMAARNGFHALFAPFAAAMQFGSLQQAAAEFMALAREAGYPDSRVMCSYFFALADDAAAERRFKERVLYYMQGISPALPTDPHATPPHMRYMTEIKAQMLKLRPGQLGERSVVTGDAERCAAQLRAVEQAGVDEVLLYLNVGAYPHADTLRMMERTARELFPHFAATRALERA
ncbi:MAG TPA: LLM class flavin-dependent oxidoreductase [Chloroflexota bacterium]|jgi:alkanesulfonate monooxygenase SsuD/methylene tetrahydromethanopterin reductase-like flavin-dependent oxidoreductase (luciferase family)